MDLSVDVSHQGTWAVVSVRGEVDVATAPRLRAALIELLAGGETQVVVDLGGVEFIDSTGLGVLIGALRRVRSADGELRLACDHDRILRVFEITGLTRVFEVHPSVESAAAA